MTLIQWQDSYNVGIDIIDKQHQMLVNLTNELYEAMNTVTEKENLGKFINRLTNYAAIHFAREEHYFELFGYPGTDRHIDQHNDFEKKIIAFEDDFNSGKQTLSIDVIRFVGDWLVNHIKGSDKGYAGFLKERGVK